MVELKSEQQAFLSECEQEFSNRYTMEDEEFKKIFDADVPAPPIMSNWYPRSKRNPRSHQGGRFRDRRSDNRYNNYDRGYDRSGNWDDYRDRSRDRN